MDMSLELREDGFAVRIMEVWLAGRYDFRDTKISRGSWEIHDNEIVIVYDDEVEKYRIIENADMKSEGFERICPRSLQHTEKDWALLWLKECLKWELPQ